MHGYINVQGWIITELSNRLKERQKPHVPKKPHSETHCQAPTKIEKPKCPTKYEGMIFWKMPQNGHTMNVLEKYPFLQTLEHVRNE